MSPQILGGLRRKRDLRAYRDYGILGASMNTGKPPFDDIRVRYAFNMATDKRAIATFLGGGRVPLKSVVPPMQNYDSPAGLEKVIDGAPYDILSFNPEAARTLLAKAGHAKKFSVE